MRSKKPKDVSQEDWDAVESPPLPDDMLAKLKPARPPGRPKAATPKQQVTLRLDQEVVRRFKATGEGWQTRINETLRASLPGSAPRKAAKKPALRKRG